MVINIGDELLIGQIVNTNAAWMAEKLNLAGIKVVRQLVIADKESDIHSAIHHSIELADFVLLTGGLGPTRDDITKKALCSFFKTELIFHEEAYQHILRLFASREKKVLEENRRQAEIPASCKAIPNPYGTAYGMWFAKNNTQIISMPGVPYEMKAMMENHVLPYFKKRQKEAIVHKTVLTQGMGESYIACKVKVWEDNLPANIALAYLPSPGMVRLRLSATGGSEEVLKRLIENEVAALHQYIPDLIFGYDKDKLEQIIGQLLVSQNCTVATAESCTGGYISQLITSIPGASRYYLGSMIAYNNHIKTNELYVHPSLIEKYGAVSKIVVEQMAVSVSKIMNSDYSVAVSGIAGPEGGTAEKKVGTVWIAVKDPEEVVAKKFQFGNSRERNIKIAAITALNMLRKRLLMKKKS